MLIYFFTVVVGALVTWACWPEPFDHSRFRNDVYAREAEGNGRQGV